MLNKIKKDKEAVYIELGKRYFQKYPEKVKVEEPELVSRLNDLDKKVQECHLSKVRDKGLMYCPKCDEEIMLDSIFCSYCGSPITEEDRVPYQDMNDKNDIKKVKMCPKCGEIVDGIEGQKFCTNCGVKL